MSMVKDRPADMVIAMNKNMQFTVKECSDTGIIKDLFVEYSHIKGAESCFVSFGKELNDLAGYYSGRSFTTVYLLFRSLSIGTSVF